MLPLTLLGPKTHLFVSASFVVENVDPLLLPFAEVDGNVNHYRKIFQDPQWWTP